MEGSSRRRGRQGGGESEEVKIFSELLFFDFPFSVRSRLWIPPSRKLMFWICRLRCQDNYRSIIAYFSDAKILQGATTYPNTINTPAATESKKILPTYTHIKYSTKYSQPTPNTILPFHHSPFRYTMYIRTPSILSYLKPGHFSPISTEYLCNAFKKPPQRYPKNRYP